MGAIQEARARFHQQNPPDYSIRRRWNRRHRRRSPRPPSPALTMMALEYLPSSGQALDIAAGCGRHGLWLARLGFDVTLVDLSNVALDRALAAARRVDVAIQTVQRDLRVRPIPHPPFFGPWDLVVCVDFMQHAVYKTLPEVMKPGGVFVCAQPTIRSLQDRCAAASDRMLAEGELPTLLPASLEVLVYREMWTPDGRHQAMVVARNSRTDR